jgi:hypothetical protein
MFLQNTSPFADWQAPGVRFASEIREAAQLGVDSLLLELWFLGFGRRFGGAAAQAARDTLSLRLEAFSRDGPRLSRLLRGAMPLHEQAFELYTSTPREARFRTIGGERVEPDPEYFVATYFLTHLESSVYFRADEAVLGLDAARLSECLTHAAALAGIYFIPMLAALDTFDTDDFPEWRWSPVPGPHEQRLQKRHEDLLRGATSSCVTSEEVYLARTRDLEGAAAQAAPGDGP